MPGVLSVMGSQRVRHDWVTELNWSHPWLLPKIGREMSFYPNDYFSDPYLTTTWHIAKQSPSSIGLLRRPQYYIVGVGLVGHMLLLLLLRHTIVSDSLWLHGLQHATLPRPSLSPAVCSNSCPLFGSTSLKFWQSSLIQLIWVTAICWPISSTC